jgi:uncharacterized protein YecE (DUF72 family)
MPSPAAIQVGTSGWHYPAGRGSWNGVFYPARRPRGFDELAYYAEHFDTVEVNATFYRALEPGQAAGWVRRTPDTFEFAVKLYQKFTHPDMYLARPGAADWDVTRADIDQARAGLDPLAEAGRLAAVLIQFPPSFHRTPDSRAYLEWLLDALAPFPAAVELRHRTWDEAREGTTALLAARGAAWVQTDAPSVAGIPAGAAGGLAYVRFHGRNAATWWDHEAAEDRYDYLYSAAELAPWASSARLAAASGRKTYLFFNNHFSAKAVASAAILKSALGQVVPGEYLPDMRRRYPALEAIVAPLGPTSGRLL